MTTEEYWAKQVEEAHKEAEVKMPSGISKKMRFAKVLIEDSDGNTRWMPYMANRCFQME